MTVFAANAGRILVSTPYAFGYIENGRFVRAKGIPGGLVTSVAKDRQGDLWIANQDKGLLRLSKDGTVQQISWASIGHKDGAQALVADRSTAGLWLGFNDGGVAYFSDGRIKETYGVAEGLGGGRVSALYIATDDTVPSVGLYVVEFTFKRGFDSFRAHHSVSRAENSRRNSQQTSDDCPLLAIVRLKTGKERTRF